MSAYTLGVDLGTTYSAAVVGRGGHVNTLQLGAEGAVVPSVVVIREDGEVLVGDAAERRASAEPARSAREFKRRLGDPVPLIVGDQPYTVEALMGYQLADIVQRATEQEGEAPTTVVLTHPANYTEFKMGKLREAATLAGLEAGRVQLLAEPEAAAISYTREQRVEPGDVIAVYDFGGGTFDAALVRHTESGFELIGIPEGMERLGGIDFDQAVLAHVDQSVGGLVTGADRSDPLTLPAQARLRVECRRAKEALSTDADTTIPVALPGLQTDVRLTRAEFESMVRPRIAQTVTALERTVASAGLTMESVSRILLVGGTSRMPVVAEMIRSATGRPVGLDAHPKLAIATGAALAGASSVTAPAAMTEPAPDWVAPTRAVPVTAPTTPDKGPGGKRWIVLVVAAAAAALVGFFAFSALSGGNDDPSTDSNATEVAPVDSGALTAPATEAPTSEPPSTEASTTESPSTDAPPPPGEGGVVDAVATIGARSMGIAIDDSGAIIAAAEDSAILQITAVDAVGSLGTVPDGVPGGVAVAPDGEVVVSTSAGVRTMSDGALLLDAATAGLGNTPGPLAFDGVGNLYLADNDNNRIIRLGTDGSLSLVAGNGADPAGAAPADGAAIAVPIGPVSGIAIDGTGRLLFADAGTGTVRAVVADGTISTVVGGGGTVIDSSTGVPEGTTATDIAFGTLDGLSVASTGRIAVADDLNGTILLIDADGSVSMAIGRNSAATRPSNGVPASESTVDVIGPLAFESPDTLAFADGVSIRRLSGL